MTTAIARKPKGRRPAEEAGPQCLTVFDFMQQHGRVPLLDEGERPWQYKGWLLYYVQQHHAYNPKVPDRWGYLLRTLEAGTLLDEPIPQILFGEPDRSVMSALEKWARIPGWDLGGWSDFGRLLEWLAWGLGVWPEASKLDDAKQERLYREVNLQPLLEAPYDYLGAWICERRATGWNPTAFYPTPHCVCECMVQMTMHDATTEGRDLRTMSVCDPCVGTGRMLLHASNFSLCLYGQDIDPLVTLITKIHGALYAPWMSFPLPDAIVGSSAPAPPAPLPVPEEHQPPKGKTAYRVDDHGQVWLF